MMILKTVIMGSLALMMSAIGANKASAQNQKTRTFAIVTSLNDTQCYDLYENQVLALAVDNNLNGQATITDHPINSRCAGVSYAGQTLYKSKLAAWVVPGSIQTRSVWFFGDQPSIGEIAITASGYQLSECYAKRDGSGKISFSNSGSGMSWRICVYTIDFIGS